MICSRDEFDAILSLSTDQRTGMVDYLAMARADSFTHFQEVSVVSTFTRRIEQNYVLFSDYIAECGFSDVVVCASWICAGARAVGLPVAAM